MQKLNKDIHIHCSENVPLKLHYSLDEGDSKNYVRFFIAPKIDD